MKIINLSILLIAISFASCTKEGATGPAGATGATGATGNANVESGTISVTPGSWTTVTAGSLYSCAITDNNITNVNADDISVSVATGSNSNFIQLPGNNILSGGDSFDVIDQNGEVIIYYFNTSAPTQSLNFKVTVIPPAQ